MTHMLSSRAKARSGRGALRKDSYLICEGDVCEVRTWTLAPIDVSDVHAAMRVARWCGSIA